MPRCLPGTSHALDITVRQADRLYFRAEIERVGRDDFASVCSSIGHLDICLFFSLQQTELLVTLCNEDVGHHFGS